MKQAKDYLDDISEIRQIMERSSNFISLSGMSGIMAGIYALIGSFVAYRIVYFERSVLGIREVYINEDATITKLAVIALVVLVLAIGTGVYLTAKKSGQNPMNLSNAGFRNLMLSLAIPLITGAFFIFILVSRGFYSIVAPSFLIFYGLALVNGSKYTLRDIRYLGLIEIILGLVCALLPGYGVIFWATGFGAMHILYGSIMYFKYER
ncbi:MAG: hypothetical protein HC819_21995 [Cyclobacteriaceae bacterium]|nr:hypothetical protein [Cyclobacteriaceae bacterium]